MGGQDKRDPWTQEVNEGLTRMKSGVGAVVGLGRESRIKVHKRAREKGLGFQWGPPRQTQLSAHLSVPRAPSQSHPGTRLSPLWPRLRRPRAEEPVQGFQEASVPSQGLEGWGGSEERLLTFHPSEMRGRVRRAQLYTQ